MTQLGQIGKRLQIIKIAISLTDDETIQLQRSKLRLYKNNSLLNNILSVIDDENYAQASNLIDRFINGSQNEDDLVESAIPEKVTTHRVKITTRTKEEEELIKKFGLLETGSSPSVGHAPLVNDEMLWLASATSAPSQSEPEIPAPQPKKPTTEEIMARYDTLIDTDLSQKSNEPIEEFDDEDENFFTTDSSEENEENEAIEEINESNIFEPAHTVSESALGQEMDLLQTKTKAQSNSFLSDEILDDAPREELKEIRSVKSSIPSSYPPISYIDQKIRNMLNQYPLMMATSEHSKEEEKLLYKISLEGYTEEDIEKAIESVNRLKEEGKLGEAARLLLTAASTESIYAQFMLARELFKGEILQRDLPEAFTQINRLAMNDYPEAICDLAQLYENGIGIAKDRKKAFNLYQDALELGIKRAEPHVARMEESSKGVFGRLFSK